MTHDEKYLRMTLNERIQHFLLLTSFITLVITGFGLKYPEAFWVRWIVAIVGQNAFELRGVVHRIAAVIMTGLSLYHLIYISFTRRGRNLVKDLWFYRSDITDLTQSIGYLTGRVKERPKFGRFSYIEKAEYWAVIWGTVVMGATGMVLWFENIFLPIINTQGMDIATAIHWYEAILASLAILVWHFYFIFMNPDVSPMNKAWLTGYLTRHQMENEHPLELEKIEMASRQHNIDISSADDVNVPIEKTKIEEENLKIDIDKDTPDTDIPEENKTIEDNPEEEKQSD